MIIIGNYFNNFSKYGFVELNIPQQFSFSIQELQQSEKTIRGKRRISKHSNFNLQTPNSNRTIYSINRTQWYRREKGTPFLANSQ